MPSRRRGRVPEPMSEAEQANLVVFTDTAGRPVVGQTSDGDSCFLWQAGAWQRQRQAKHFKSEAVVLSNLQEVTAATAAGQIIRVVSVSRVRSTRVEEGVVLTAAPFDEWGEGVVHALTGSNVMFTLCGEQATAAEMRAVRRLQTAARDLHVECVSRGRRPRFRSADRVSLQAHADAAVSRYLVGPEAEQRHLLGQTEPAMLVAGLIPTGLVVLVGQHDTGKSTLVADLGATVAAGQDWLGRPTTGGSVLIVCGERATSTRARTTAAATRLGLALGPTVLEVPWNLHGEDADRSFMKLGEAIKTMGGLRLLVIDTLGSLTAGMPEADVAAMSALMRRFHRLLSNHPGLTVLLVHHPLKNGHGVRGHGALEASADAVLELASRAGAVELSLRSSNHLPPGARHRFGLAVDDDGVLHVKHLGGVRPEARDAGPADSSTRDAAAAALLTAARAAGGPLSREELAEAAGIGKTTFYELAKGLPELVAVPGRRGYYQCMEGGEAHDSA